MMSPRILIVDDDIDNVRLLGEVLAGLGRVYFATDGKAALLIAAKQKPDLVLLDAEMPGMSGFDVCEALKADAATADSAVIFVTAYSDIEHETRALGIGAVDFIAKPISPPIVRARVQTHLTLKYQADALRYSLDRKAAEHRSAVVREAETAVRLEATVKAVRALVDATPVPSAVLERGEGGGLRLAWANQRFADVMGKPLAAIVGADLATLLPPGADLAGLAAGGDGEARLVVAIDRPDGPAEIELLLAPVRGEDRLSGLVMLSAHDPTAERLAARKEAERYRLEALGRMAGRIAHEINNVLQPIISHASLARHLRHDEAALLDHLDDIQTAVRSGREIVRSVLALAGGNAVVRHPRVLEDEVVRALDLVMATIPARITVDTAIGATAGTVALAPAELLQILGNLVINSVDAIAGVGTIRVETARLDLDPAAAASLGVPAGPYARLAVSDTGSGMSRDTLVRAMDPYFTTKAVDKGSGLGLATVRVLVDGMGGSVTLVSEPGRGTAVRVLFPLTAVG